MKLLEVKAGSLAGALRELALPNCKAKFLTAVHHFLQFGSVRAAPGFGASGVEATGSTGHYERVLESASRNVVGGKNSREGVSTTYRANHI